MEALIPARDDSHGCGRAPAAMLHMWACALAALAALAAFGAALGQERIEERDVKAAFLFRFASYVEWPEHAFGRPDGTLVIAVAGNDGVYERLAYIVAGRSVGRHPVAARRVNKGESVTGVHILFVGAGAGAWGSELASQARRRPILVVTEADAAGSPASVINFVVTDNRVRFDVSMEAAEANGLRLSALLLSVARQVRGKPW